MYDNGMIAPVVGLVIWSLVMLVWLYATRLPAMAKASKKPGEMTRADVEALPSASVANNYNHLMEQPTIFYAICFALELLGQATETNIGLAWLYVALRVVHTMLQVANQIMFRFLVFVAASIVLAILTASAALQVFG